MTSRPSRAAKTAARHAILRNALWNERLTTATIVGYCRPPDTGADPHAGLRQTIWNSGRNYLVWKNLASFHMRKAKIAPTVGEALEHTDHYKRYAANSEDEYCRCKAAIHDLILANGVTYAQKPQRKPKPTIISMMTETCDELEAELAAKRVPTPPLTKPNWDDDEYIPL
jgi:hypothetical protein